MAKNIYSDNVKIDYFAVSLPDLLLWDEDLNHRNKIHCNYLIGLGHLGMGNKKTAAKLFSKNIKDGYKSYWG